jgi:hypothetical protein
VSVPLPTLDQEGTLRTPHEQEYPHGLFIKGYSIRNIHRMVDEPVDPEVGDLWISPNWIRLRLETSWIDISGGGGGGVGSYTHTQQVTSSSWVVDHPLPHHPQVTIVTSTGVKVLPGGVEYPYLGRVVVSFNASFSGEAYLR